VIHYGREKIERTKERKELFSYVFMYRLIFISSITKKAEKMLWVFMSS